MLLQKESSPVGNPRTNLLQSATLGDYTVKPTRFTWQWITFFLLNLCSSGHGAWGQCVPCWGASKPPNTKQIMVDLPAQLPKTCLRLSILDLSQGGRFAEGSGKRRKIWPRGRFGLIFGAKPI